MKHCGRHFGDWFAILVVLLAMHGCGTAASHRVDRQPPASADSDASVSLTSDYGEDPPVVPPACEAATWGEPGSLYQSWVAAPDTHPNLPNISYAGYRYGAALPRIDPRVRVHVTDFGAVPGSLDDASDAVAAALAAVSSTGGAVVFPQGEFRFRRPIAMQHSHTVLMGAGAGRTRLIFEQSLDAGYARNIRDTDTSLWSWLGGMVWLSPSGLRAFPAQSPDVNANWQEGWIRSAVNVAITEGAPRGARRIAVAPGHGLVVGQRVLIELDTSESLLKHLAGDGTFADAQDWSSARAGWLLPPARPSIVWPVEIARVDVDAIELAQPLRFDLRAAWSPRVIGLSDVLEESGVIGMSLVMLRSTPYVSERDHHHEVGWNGLYIENAWNCFAADLEIVDSENGILISASKNITLRDFAITSSTDALALQHHGTVTRHYANDILFEDFTIEAQPIHGINVEGFSMGNVWSRGTLHHGTWDRHRGLPIENLATQLDVTNDGDGGGRGDAGPPMGARHVSWNIEIRNDNCRLFGQAEIMPNGAIVGLRGCTPRDPRHSGCTTLGSGPTGNTPTPPNLYEAQRAVRTCTPSE